MSARDDSSPKVGAGHAEAMLRQRLSELRGAFFNESNVAQPAQYGLYGTKTPGEVAEARRDGEAAGEARQPDEEPRSILGERLERAEQSRDVRERETRGLDRE